MKLTNPEFVKLLSEHLSMDEESTSAQLAKMVAEFNKSVENGEVFKINGLGSFSMEEGSIEFNPTEEFATEINHSFEGMQPVDVDAALVIDSDIVKPNKSKKTVKKDIIIVDQGVEGEEDPFGIDNDEPSVLDSSKLGTDVTEGESEEDMSEPIVEKSQLKESHEEINEVEQEEESMSTGYEASIISPLDEFVKNDDESDFQVVAETEEPLLKINTRDNENTEDETEDIFDFIGVKLDENQPTPENPSEEVEIESTENIIEEHELVAEIDLAEKSFEEEELTDTAITDDEDGISGGPRIVKLEEHKKSQRNISGILKIVGIAALVLILIGGGWWTFNTYFSSAFGSQTSQPIVMAIGPQDDAAYDQVSQDDEDAMFQPGVSVPLGSADDDPLPVETSEAVATDIVEQPTSAPQQQAVTTTTAAPSSPVPDTAPATAVMSSNDIYGLRGSSRDIQGVVFSIIVHSLPSQNSANEECDKIVASGLRCIVRVATRPDGRTTYRVGIGQFPSMNAAQDQINSLDEPFRSRNFVARVN